MAIPDDVPAALCAVHHASPSRRLGQPERQSIRFQFHHQSILAGECFCADVEPSLNPFRYDSQGIPMVRDGRLRGAGKT